MYISSIRLKYFYMFVCARAHGLGANKNNYMNINKIDNSYIHHLRRNRNLTYMIKINDVIEA